jgi:hypothetical protein
VVELILRDDDVADLGDPVRGNRCSTAGEKRGTGSDGQCDAENARHRNSGEFVTEIEAQCAGTEPEKPGS